VPTGELPRSLSVTCDRHLVGTVSPGTRVTLVGVYSIHNAKEADKGKKEAVAIRQPFIRCAPRGHTMSNSTASRR
jgi:DNA replication licensing factor MCM5